MGILNLFHEQFTNWVQVDYFMRRRIIDKRKEAMYAEGATVQWERGVGQVVSSK